MKFTIKDKTLIVTPATLRQIHKLENNVGNVAKLTEDAPFDTVIKMITQILKEQPQEDVTIDWLLDNTDMSDLATINEVVGHFLGVKAIEPK